MIGRRVYPDDEGNLHVILPGDYGKFGDGWLLCVPTGIHGLIKEPIWKIIEHDNGTITVSPSIDVKSHIDTYNWHGYLEKGVWRKV